MWQGHANGSSRPHEGLSSQVVFTLVSMEGWIPNPACVCTTFVQVASQYKEACYIGTLREKIHVHHASKASFDLSQVLTLVGLDIGTY